MKTVSKRKPAHHRSMRVASAPNYYQQVVDPAAEVDPIEVAVARRLRNKGVHARIVRLQRQILAKIGEGSKPFLELEELRNDARADREEAYFNVGYEHGMADAFARARRESMLLSKEANQMARTTRERMVQMKLPPWQAMLCLLECLWSLAAKEAETTAS